MFQLVTIIDPVSRWILAETIPAGCENIPKFIGNFMFKTFCCFGFPKVELLNFNSIQYELIVQEYNEITAQTRDLIPDLKILQSDISLKSDGEDSLHDHDIANHLINPSEVSINIWLLRLRLQETESGMSPFQTMFSRRIAERSPSDPGDIKQTRRKLQSSVLLCRHCEESFTSKISFRIHQRRHTEEARLRGQREGEAPVSDMPEDDGGKDEKEAGKKSPAKLRKVGSGRGKLQKRKRLAKLAEKWSQEDDSLDEHYKQEVSESAARAVQVLLKATRDERQKRGKYLRYSPELRDEIAEFALQHGQTAAAQHYTEKLNLVVAESSVRNFVRVFQKFPQQLRYEIGNHASHHGLEATAKFYSAKLGQEVSRGLVRRFRKQFAETGRGGEVSGKSGQVYSQELREEIGRYAGMHGVEAAVQVYSEKLLFSVKPSTVRKFRQLYGDTGPENLSYIQLSETSSTTIDLLHSSLDVLNQNSATYIPNYSGNPNLYSLQNSYPALNLPDGERNAPVPPSQPEEAPTAGPSASSGPSAVARTVKPTKVKKENKKISRGRYVQYSDELRAKIGKFALKHGNASAMKHFYAELGHEIPESTIRGMRDKYQLMVEKKGEGVSKVGCGPRGRPASLGNHDVLVQEAVKKLKEKGEKINAFVVIAVAKQVIMQQDPSLLHEFGGQVKLNTTWAKSMLRRLGIKNKTGAA